MPPGEPTDETPKRIDAELEALTARLESYCFAKLSSEDPADGRVRAFQHLLETRDVMVSLRRAMSILSRGSAFEAAPWIRALALGSGLPGTGQQLRHGSTQLASMGLYAPHQSGTPTPGGMPLHAYLEMVLLPEKGHRAHQDALARRQGLSHPLDAGHRDVAGPHHRDRRARR